MDPNPNVSGRTIACTYAHAHTSHARTLTTVLVRTAHAPNAEDGHVHVWRVFFCPRSHVHAYPACTHFISHSLHMKEYSQRLKCSRLTHEGLLFKRFQRSGLTLVEDVLLPSVQHSFLYHSLTCFTVSQTNTRAHFLTVMFCSALHTSGGRAEGHGMMLLSLSR